MAKRTLGWVQNPGSLRTLKNVVAMFVPTSPFREYLKNVRLPLLLKNDLISEEHFKLFVELLNHSSVEPINYAVLKGKGGSTSRKKVLCTGLVQACIDAQKNVDVKTLSGETTTMKKPYVDDWSADGYLRWAISTGLVEYDVAADVCKVSPAGERLVNAADGSKEEHKIYGEALLSYPPVCRVLSLLGNKEPHTKFEIGRELGFVGEKGFTSVPQAYYAAILNEVSPTERASVRNNLEGDSDKYGRMIAGWCQKMGWVTKVKVIRNERYDGSEYTLKIDAFKITVMGERALKRSEGYSRYPKIPKRVFFEMLATKATDAKFLRHRRARIIEYLKSGKKVSVDSIAKYLQQNGIVADAFTIKDDLKGLARIGLNIIIPTDNNVVMTDKIIDLIIPQEKVICEQITEIKDRIRRRLLLVDHRYLTLVDLAYSDAADANRKNADAKEFELETASLFVDELKFFGKRLGSASRPDVVVSYDTYGLIIDNKSYSNGFSVDAHNADEMARYVLDNKNRLSHVPPNEWWKWFSEDVCHFYFLFVTSFFKGNYRDNLRGIALRTGIDGAGINVEQLLYVAEAIKSTRMTHEELFALMKNDEIIVM